MNDEDCIDRGNNPARFVFDLKGYFDQCLCLRNHPSPEWLTLGIGEGLSEEAAIFFILHMALEECPRFLWVPVEILDKGIPKRTEGRSPQLGFEIQNGID